MEPILLKKITEELNSSLRGAIISKIHQPNNSVLIIKLFIRGREYKLLISADPLHPRVHITEKKYPNPESPLRFCAYLRAHLSNAVIKEVRSLGGERIAEITLDKKRDGSESETLKLVLELTGKSSNIILIDSRRVVMDALKYFPPESSQRAVSPGVELTPLIGKASAKESLIEKTGATWNESADSYYTGIYEDAKKIKFGNDLRRVVRKVEKRLKRKKMKLSGDIKRAENNIKNSLSAELLLANFRSLKRGMDEITLDDYTQTPVKAVKIKLDKKLAPNENIDRLFKLAKKGKRTIELTTRRLPEITKDLEYLNSLYFSLERAGSLDDLELVKDELIKAEYIKERKVKKKNVQKDEKKSEPIEKITREDEVIILIGKSGIGNDQIVKKYARAGDLWFHAKGSPGAHVLLKPDKFGRHCDKAITEAAGYAAGRSKISESTKIEVIVAKAEQVKKPKGARPGTVTVAKYKTLMVEPKR